MEKRETPAALALETHREYALAGNTFNAAHSSSVDVAKVADVEIEPFTTNCSHILARADHVLLGISALNSYYTPKNVAQLIRGCSRRFRRVDVLIAGYEQAYTLVATGIEPRVAVRRAQRAIRTLRNSAVGALTGCGLEDPAKRVNSWTQLSIRPGYRTLRERAGVMYDEDPSWRNACRDTTRAALRSLAVSEPTDTAIETAVPFTLAELPLLLDSPSIYGTDSSVFTYHRPMPLIDFVLRGKCAANQGFALLTLASDRCEKPCASIDMTNP
ncbi:tRNA-dependent cyclodipeptide synthase [Brucella intermedia]|uniref:tRNA-dependent cyclodipeptide synthase n=1 Tax=Brucella intermedia TaxID=94625 RepID=UPI00124D007E|nr:tRNA-dependent cyclodipeptide synthase [Brucella intermedia]KAB2722420.1 tRNA-dependent cyclodipeptide synthase [Brucella intermedia]